MRALLGLGNPGPDYAQTRHNFGVLLVERLLRRSRRRLGPSLGPCREAEVILAGVEVVLAVSTTFMNHSGQAAALLARRHGFEPRELALAYDDLDLPLGRLRLRERGSDGGHRGVRSVLAALGSQEVPRVRLGIRPAEPIAEPVEFVLQPFAADERPLVEAVLERACEAVCVALRRGWRQAMSQFNSTAVELARES